MRFTVLLLLGGMVAGCDRSPDAGGTGEIILNQRLSARIQTLDPSDVTDTTSSAVCEEFYECLYGYHYLKRPHQIIPELAADLPQISDDGLTYRIQIKPGVLFHDDACFPGGKGRELKANDFVYAWKRIANVKVQSKNWWVFDGRVVGLDAFREYSKTCKKGEVDYSRTVEGLYAEDDYTLIIKLNRPWPQFIYWLAHLPTTPMAKEAVDYYGLDIIQHPVGTGAFVLKTWRRGVYLDAVRNPTYRPVYYPSEGTEEDVAAGLLADAGKRLPFVDRVIWRSVQEDQPRWYIFMRGEIDINGIPKDNFGQAIGMGSELTEDMKKRDIQLMTCDEPAAYWVGMNMDDPVLGVNKALRYAVSHSIDRERFIDLLMNGRGHPAYGLLPPMMKGYNPEVKKYSNSYYDPQKALAYLKEAKEQSGGAIPQLRLAMSGTTTTHRQIGLFLKQNLEAIGLSVEVELYDWPTYLERLHKSELQMYFSGWMADYPDPENFLQVFYGKNIPNPNHSHYCNPAFDALFERAASLPEGPEQTALYHEAEKILVNDMPCVFTYHRIGYIIHHHWVDNIKPDSYRSNADGGGLLKYYKVNAEKRSRYRREY